MKSVNKSILFFVFVITITQRCSGGPNERRLLHHLLDKYNVLERPVSREENPLIVSLDVKLTSIVYVNSQVQQIGANFIFRYEWEDVNMQWNESEFSGVETVNIPPHRMWKPSTRVLKEANGDSVSDYWDSNVVTSNGRVWQEHSAKVELICCISIIDFPFDEHDCKLEFFSSIYTPEEMVITTFGEKVEQGDISDFSPSASPEFHLLGFPVKLTNDEDKSHVSYSIRIRRNGDVHWKFVLIYCTISSLMIILSCLSSPTASYKLGTSLIGILTSVYAIQDLVSRVCTYSHNNVPVRIIEFFVNLLTINLVAFISNSLVVYVYNLQMKMPSKLRDILKRMDHSCSCLRPTEKSVKLRNETNEVTKLARDEMQVTGMVDIKSSDKETNVQTKCGVQSDWQQFALMIDRFLFIVWTAIVIMFVTICLPKFNFHA